jgi:hypothetical protein
MRAGRKGESWRFPGVTKALKGKPSWLTAAWSLNPRKDPLDVYPHLASGSFPSSGGVESTIRSLHGMGCLRSPAIFSKTFLRSLE